jgi:hypothetical protein
MSNFRVTISVFLGLSLVLALLGCGSNSSNSNNKRNSGKASSFEGHWKLHSFAVMDNTYETSNKVIRKNISAYFVDPETLRVRSTADTSNQKNVLTVVEKDDTVLVWADQEPIGPHQMVKVICPYITHPDYPNYTANNPDQSCFLSLKNLRYREYSVFDVQNNGEICPEFQVDYELNEDNVVAADWQFPVFSGGIYLRKTGKFIEEKINDLEKEGDTEHLSQLKSANIFVDLETYSNQSHSTSDNCLDSPLIQNGDALVLDESYIDFYVKSKGSDESICGFATFGPKKAFGRLVEIRIDTAGYLVATFRDLVDPDSKVRVRYARTTAEDYENSVMEAFGYEFDDGSETVFKLNDNQNRTRFIFEKPVRILITTNSESIYLKARMSTNGATLKAQFQNGQDLSLEDEVYVRDPLTDEIDSELYLPALPSSIAKYTHFSWTANTGFHALAYGLEIIDGREYLIIKPETIDVEAPFVLIYNLTHIGPHSTNYTILR